MPSPLGEGAQLAGEVDLAFSIYFSKNFLLLSKINNILFTTPPKIEKNTVFTKLRSKTSTTMCSFFTKGHKKLLLMRITS